MCSKCIILEKNGYSVKNVYRKQREVYSKYNRQYESITKEIVERFRRSDSLKGQRAVVVLIWCVQVLLEILRCLCGY